MTDPAVLSVRGLTLHFVNPTGPPLRVVDRVSFELLPRETLGIVGESGSGKTMVCRSLIGTQWRYGAHVSAGSIVFRDQDLVGAPESTWRRIRGREIAYVPQSSMAGLNPVISVGRQLTSILAVDDKSAHVIRRGGLAKRAVELLSSVEIPRPEHVMRQRPHELSGGMRQRVMIAGALARVPAILIADEPTTALDVRVQRHILDLLKDLQSRLQMAMIFVSHDLGVIDDICDRTLVMYAGAVVEIGDSEAVRSSPIHPYSDALRSASVLKPHQDLSTIPGEAPPVGGWPDGCRFWPRCGLTLRMGGGEALEQCRSGFQPLPRSLGDMGHETACLLAEEMAADG